MKKVVYTITGVILLSLFTFTQSITIVKPNNRSTWAKNEANTIEWRKSGEMGDRVKIRLFNHNGSVRIMGITDNTANNGSFRCPPNMFNDVPDGTYTVRVRTIDNRVTGDSNVFSIDPPPTIVSTPPGTELPETQRTPPSPPFGKLIKKPTKFIPNLKGNLRHLLPSIVITHPPKDHVWRLRLGDTSQPFPIRVMWRKTGVGNQDSRVKIFLRRVVNGVQTTLLTQNTANDGLFRSGISRDLISSMYTILIQTLDGKIRVESDTFLIINAENDPH